MLPVFFLGPPSVSSLTSSKVEGTIATYSCETEVSGTARDDLGNPTLTLYQGETEITDGLSSERDPDGTNQYIFIRVSKITFFIIPGTRIYPSS